MRHPGHPSRQVMLVPPTAIDVKFGRPPAPEGFSEPEVRLWERLVLARRPNWYLGAEAVLQSYVTTVINNQRLEAAIRRARVGPSPRYVTLSRLHRQGALLAATLATRLRLTPSTAIDKNISRDGTDKPVAVSSFGYPAQQPVSGDDVSLCDANGERSFEKLRQHMQRDGGRAQTIPHDEPSPPSGNDQSESR